MLRVADRLGIPNMVHAPTKERKRQAANILSRRSAHFIKYFGWLTIEAMAP